MDKQIQKERYFEWGSGEKKKIKRNEEREIQIERELIEQKEGDKRREGIDSEKEKDREKD